MEKYFLKITSAVVIDGDIRRPGAIVEVDERVATDLLRREKAEPATDADQAPDAAAEPADDQADQPAKRGRKPAAN